MWMGFTSYVVLNFFEERSFLKITQSFSRFHVFTHSQHNDVRIVEHPPTPTNKHRAMDRVHPMRIVAYYAWSPGRPSPTQDVDLRNEYLERGVRFLRRAAGEGT